MPLMMVWPDSWSVDTRKDGSSAARRIERDAHLFLVGLGLRLHRDLDDRLGEFHALEDDRCLGSHSVSPVVVSFRPASATMSPAKASLMSSRSVGMHHQHAADALSFLSLTEFSIASPLFSVPE
jgi:hypothetical protein